MTIRISLLPTTAAVVTLLPLATPAHHPLGEVYDRASPVSLTGTVVRIDWVNPHAIFRLNVQDSAGSTVEWIVELDPPHLLERRGIAEDAIVAGQSVTVEGFRAVDGARHTYAKTVTPTNGETLTVSSDASWNWRRLGEEIVFPPAE